MTFIKNYILRLQEKIRYYGYLYYSLGSPIISDSRYDYLIKKLKYLENKYKFTWLKKDSPTLTIGSPGLLGLKKYKHITPMLSLNHVFTASDYLNFYTKVKVFLKEQKINFCCELKIDGLAINLIYRKGTLKKAITRGDGITGEDVTSNIYLISSIPKQLCGFNLPRTLEVRGEIFMLKSDFARLNNKAINNHTKTFSNTRNASSGLLLQKHLKTDAIKNLVFCCHGYGYFPDNLNMFDHSSRLIQLKNWGLPISGYSSIFNSNADILNFYKKIKSIRDFLDFDIDGIVIKVNSIIFQNKLGYTHKAPRWSVALKFFDKEKVSKILKVIYQIGRTGVITPVAQIEPICISGVTIRKVSLHNFNVIKQLDLHIGDVVTVKRSGDVIPKIVSVVKCYRSNHAQRVVSPKLCPVCKSKIKLDDNSVKVRCSSGVMCKGQLKKLLYYFCSKHGLNIYGLGYKIISKLVDNNYINNFSDFFNLTYDKLSNLDDIGKKTVLNIISSINQSKNITLSKFLCALGIRDIGLGKSKIITKHFTSLNNLMNANIQDFYLIKGIGLNTAHYLFNFLNNKSNKEMVFHLSKNLNIYSDHINRNSIVHKSNILFNKRIAISGSLQTFFRVEVINIIKKLGGHVTSNVSKNTDYIIVGKNPGSKFIKSRTLNTKVMLEHDLLKIIKICL
ncbi:NAD-dependent DNA ligase LigA [Buchnera aphidicola]|uniref:DNA ligase n=1 Tax=Buchnera aphidicola subsp. Melaphis rhois TaxID=118103 RepID=A0A4D6YAK7_BUCMH|nr:NAD-dependent DNA ligase LigA [Buchnera aphidicola]QCI23104.1 NAD-dependent DNA ligase LigA [Buchnera aphidicola (Melaphis rhois)]